MDVKERKKELCYEPTNGWKKLTEEQKQALERYCNGYKAFLNDSKTERMCVKTAIVLAEQVGFQEYHRGMELKPGSKIYVNNRDKAIMLAVMGKEPLSAGIHIGAAHTDAPRLDLKPHPLLEKNEMAYLKTHHYGGIKKYQWVNIPLELHGVVVKKDGTSVEVHIGDSPEDPIFVINDLLPHLSKEQNTKTLAEGIASEDLNLLVGGEPVGDEEGSDLVKLQVLELLNATYGITEEDFFSAELCAVPAMKARDVGLDRSYIGAYGQDDRVCAYAEFAAILETECPEKTAFCLFADKEEIGSEGVTGMKSHAFDSFVADLCAQQGVTLRDCFAHSFCLSADVTAAFDPNFASVYESNNSAYVNYGIGLCKYTGSGGKSLASDASAEVVGYIRKLLNDHHIQWQMAELGKNDAGGGGTVAKYLAERNINVLDAGVPVLAMHSPYEVTSKYDCYMTYLTMKAFFNN